MPELIEITPGWEATDSLLSGGRYSPVYRIKEGLFRRVAPLAAIYSFNKHQRDEWIAEKSREIAPGSRVIDVGAGSCPYRHLFAHCEYVAHDVGKLQDHQLRGRGGYGHLHLVSDISEIPVESGSFDVVLCTEVLEHVPEPIRAVGELGRILKPGGRLFLTAPLRSALHQMPYHFYAGYTPTWYERFLANAGFSDLRITPVCGVFNAYGEASLYLSLYLSPFSSSPLRVRSLLFPLWLLTLPWFLACPLFCAALDKLGLGKEFTVGYRVEATKA